MAAYSYEYRVKGLYKAPAQVAGEICETLAKSETGLTPAALVDVSRPQDAPLHDDFEWRDKEAAEKYREVQAQGIIRNIVCVPVTTGEMQQETVRAFISMPGRESKYATLETTLSNDTLHANMLDMAKREMEQFISKYRRLSELSGVITAIDAALQRDA